MLDDVFSYSFDLWATKGIIMDHSILIVRKERDKEHAKHEH